MYCHCLFKHKGVIQKSLHLRNPYRNEDKEGKGTTFLDTASGILEMGQWEPLNRRLPSVLFNKWMDWDPVRLLAQPARVSQFPEMPTPAPASHRC